MIVRNFDVERIAAIPDETEPPLIINTDAVLSFAIAVQRFESLPGGDAKSDSFTAASSCRSLRSATRSILDLNFRTDCRL